MRYLTAATALAATAVLGGCAGSHAAPRPAVCHFDGGGTITAGNAARTTEGTLWQCTENGTLIRLAADEVTPWQRVVLACQRHRDCVPTPAVIRRADGIAPHAPSFTRYGDTTYTWVRGPRGTVKTYTS